MPKNEIGEVYCINQHINKNPMTKEENPAMMSTIIKEEGLDKPTIRHGRGFVFDVYTCEECGYNELYDFVDTNNLLKEIE